VEAEFADLSQGWKKKCCRPPAVMKRIIQDICRNEYEFYYNAAIAVPPSGKKESVSRFFG